MTLKAVSKAVSLASSCLKRKMEEHDALKVAIEALKAEVSAVQADGQKSEQA